MSAHILNMATPKKDQNKKYQLQQHYDYNSCGIRQWKDEDKVARRG